MELGLKDSYISISDVYDEKVYNYQKKIEYEFNLKFEKRKIIELIKELQENELLKIIERGLEKGIDLTERINKSSDLKKENTPFTGTKYWLKITEEINEEDKMYIYGGMFFYNKKYLEYTGIYLSEIVGNYIIENKIELKEIAKRYSKEILSEKEISKMNEVYTYSLIEKLISKINSGEIYLFIEEKINKKNSFSINGKDIVSVVSILKRKTEKVRLWTSYMGYINQYITLEEKTEIKEFLKFEMNNFEFINNKKEYIEALELSFEELEEEL
jgi:hypothetical protein